MTIFKDDETAWSALTKALETVIQPSGDTVIVQASSVFRPLASQPGVDRSLAMFHKLLVAERVPNYGNKNGNSYIDTGALLQNAYQQYLQALNVALTNRYASTIDIPAINDLKDRYNKAAKAMSKFKRAADKDWGKQKRANPGLTRIQWDQDYGDFGYTPQLKELMDDVTQTYGYWQAKANPYPELSRVVKRIYDCDNNPVNRVALPTSDDELHDDPASWQSFLKANLDLQDFFAHDAPQQISINQTSSTSTSYESRWSAGGSVSYGFFSVGGSASGGSVEQHLRSGSQSLSFKFDRLVPIPIIRGAWYDEGLLRLPYNTYVDSAEYWSSKGQLPLVPIFALIGRGLEVSIATDSATFDSFQTWHNASGSLGFSFGPWAVGGGANSSSSSNSVTNTSTGTTIAFKDNSNTPYVLAVVSLKMDEWLKSTIYRDQGRKALDELIEEAEAFERSVPFINLIDDI